MGHAIKSSSRRAAAKAVRLWARWTHDEDKRLSFLWGFSVRSIAEQLGRTPTAVISRAMKLKLGPPSRGTHSLSSLERDTGYDRKRVRTALEHLGLLERRAVSASSSRANVRNARYNRLALDEDAVTRVVEFLSKHPDAEPLYGPNSHRATHGVWGVGWHPPACLECNRTDRPHDCKGLCTSCYQKRNDRNFRLRKQARRAAETSF